MRLPKEVSRVRSGETTVQGQGRRGGSQAGGKLEEKGPAFSEINRSRDTACKR